MRALYTFQKINDILIVRTSGGRATKTIKDKSKYTRKNKHKKSST